MAVPSTDLLTHMDEWMIPEKKYLWISFSRSGDSPEGVAVLESARRNHPDIHHLVVSCNVKGRMIREIADEPRGLGICLDDAVNDRGLAMTSSFSNMVIFGQCLAHTNDPGTYEGVLSQLVQAGREFLPRAADSAAALAKKAYTKACFVGSGALRAVAKESALKLVELTAGKTLTMSESVSGLATWSDGGFGPGDVVRLLSFGQPAGAALRAGFAEGDRKEAVGWVQGGGGRG